MRELVDKALNHEGESVTAGRAKGSRANPQRHYRGVQRIVRDEALREFSWAHGSGGNEPLAFTVADEVIAPGDQLARGIETCLQVLEASWTIIIVRHIVFTGPEQFHRKAGLLGDERGLHHVIIVETAPESASAADHMDGDFLVLQSQRLHYH